jgi:hypothetical protein
MNYSQIHSIVLCLPEVHTIFGYYRIMSYRNSQNYVAVESGIELDNLQELLLQSALCACTTATCQCLWADRRHDTIEL